MKKYILPPLLFLFIGCSSSSLTYTNSQLKLKVENKALHIKGQTIATQKDNFAIVFITQKMLKLEDGSHVVYEYAQTDMAYEFAQTTKRSIATIFDTQEVREVYNHALVYGYQLILKEGHLLNILVSQSFDQEITMVYGMSTKKFDTMLQNLSPQHKPLLYQNTLTGSKVLSHWTTWKVNFFPLVQPLPRLMQM